MRPFVQASYSHVSRKLRYWQGHGLRIWAADDEKLGKVIEFELKQYSHQ